MHVTFVIQRDAFGTGKLSQPGTDFAETLYEFPIKGKFLHPEVTGFAYINMIFRPQSKIGGVKQFAFF